MFDYCLTFAVFIKTVSTDEEKHSRSIKPFHCSTDPLFFGGFSGLVGTGNRARPISVFTASPCDSLGLMLLPPPDSSLFLIQWDSPMLLVFLIFTCPNHNCVPALLCSTPLLLLYSQVLLLYCSCSFHPSLWNKRTQLYKKTLISHLGLFL